MSNMLYNVYVLFNSRPKHTWTYWQTPYYGGQEVANRQNPPSTYPPINQTTHLTILAFLYNLKHPPGVNLHIVSTHNTHFNYNLNM